MHLASPEPQTPLNSTVVQLLASLLFLLAFLRFISSLDEEGAERDDASDDESWNKRVSCTSSTMEGAVGSRLTNGELAVKPEPGKSRALHLPSFSSSVVVDVVKDATSNDCDGYGEEDKTKDQA